MSHRYGVLEGNQIVNVVVWKGATWAHDPDTLIEIDDDMPIGIGWRLVDGVWEPPLLFVEPDPEVFVESDIPVDGL